MPRRCRVYRDGSSFPATGVLVSQPVEIIELSRRIGQIAEEKIAKIAKINRATSYLALNALIEASRAGAAGDGFSVVAREVKQVSGQISQISGELADDLTAQIRQLAAVGDRVMARMQAQQGRRLSDLALNLVDIIDRNLYERSCDVRWWATDAAVVDVLENPGPDSARHACARLGVILDSYTVYLDLWVIDARGQVVASGRPGRYPSVAGARVAEQPWFTRAMATSNGQDFVCTDIERNPWLGGAPVATYATAIRRGGEANGVPIGALVIHFDWATQSQAVVAGARFDDDERPRARAMLLDSRHRVIASSDDRGVLEETYGFQPRSKAMGWRELPDGRLLGFARTPGYETYPGMGWYGAIELRPSAEADGADADAGADAESDDAADSPNDTARADGKSSLAADRRARPVTA
jgi:hypothetical protein